MWCAIRLTLRGLWAAAPPTPIEEEELAFLKKRMGADEPKFKVEFAVGDLVKIHDGPFKDYEGKVGRWMKRTVKLKLWLPFSAAKHRWNWIFCRLKKM